MEKYIEPVLDVGEKQLTVFERVLFYLSTYAVPGAVGLFSLVAILTFEKQLPETVSEPLALRVAAETDAMRTPEDALARLQSSPLVLYHDTRRSETPFWYVFAVPPITGDSETTVEFPSRHAIATTCWDAATLKSFGHGTLHGADGKFSLVKAGFALSLGHIKSTAQVLCRTSSSGPARLSALRWQASQLATSAELFHRNSGLLDGGLIVLTLFALLTALINRERIYVLFAAWLVVNLRIGALSVGWDTQWLGFTVPPEWLPQMRSLTIAVYTMLTVTLFRTLFRHELQKLGYGYMMRVAEWVCPPLLLAAVILPYKSFLPVMWISGAVAIVVLVFFTIRILAKKQSAVAMWYGGSIGISLLTSLYEIVSAAFGIKIMIGSVNSVTAALSSSLLAALAIAEQIRMKHEQMLEAQTKLAQAFEAMPIGLFTLDLQGNFVSANSALCVMLNQNVLTDGHSSWEQHFEAGTWLQLYDQVNGSTSAELEIKGKAANSIECPKRFLAKATLANGKIEGSLQDVTEKSKAIDRLQFLVNNDPLTKVLNRRGIEKVLDSAKEQLAEGKLLALAYLDLDRFKLINDLFGHAAGDEVLKQVCERIGTVLSDNQQIGRIGGDEFVIVLPDTTIALATWICRGIIDLISTEVYRVGDKAFQVRGSIGLIEVTPEAKMKDALSAADRACRKAKTGQNENLVVYEKSAVVIREHEAELALVERLSGDSGFDGLFLLMQPIMSLQAPYDSLNFEVLLRMRDHDGIVIPASRLISAGENCGRMARIDRWVLSTTLAWLAMHHEQLTTTQFVCLNLNGASLNDEGFVQDAFAMLTKHIHVAKRLCFEITESVALHDLENTHRFIEKIRGYGSKVALDDFGAGYTSFSYLRDLPADIIKIDGSFIVDMNKHPTNVAIVGAIVNLANNLGMKTIAEWAEDNATVQVLSEIGVDYVQGFAVARPQDPENILQATSSASFIQDAKLASFARTLAAPGTSSLRLNLFETTIKPKKLN